ncbi:MAG TPA: NAD(P)H-dependent oxidoreductase [Methanocellaceae archaeon]|jgi:flavodoxin
MKTLIACYSVTGNTLKVAQDLKARLNADFTNIETKKETNYLMKCINALLNRKTPIKPCVADMKDYDLLIVCSPVWASSTPPAVNEYVAELKNCDGKKYAILITYGGVGGNRVESHIKKAMLPKNIAFMGSIFVRVKAVEQGAYEKDAGQFAAAISE